MQLELLRAVLATGYRRSHVAETALQGLGKSKSTRAWPVYERGKKRSDIIISGKYNMGILKSGKKYFKTWILY